MRIRSKLLLLLTVPLLAVSVAAAAGFRAQSSASEDAETALEVSEHIYVVHRVAAAVVLEQLMALGGDLDPEQTVADTDASLAALQAHGRATLDDQLLAVGDDVGRQVAAARSATDPMMALQAYGGALMTMVEVQHDVSTSFPTNEALNQYFVTRMVGNGIAAQIQAWLTYLSFQPETDMTQNLATATALFTTSRQYYVAADEISQGEDQGLDDVMNDLARLEAVALDDLGEGQITLGPAEIIPSLTEATVGWMDLIETRDDQLLTMIQAELDDADSLRSLFSLLALLGAVVLGGMVFVIYRSITHPLNDLLVRADVVANEELPNLVRTLRQTDDVTDLPEATPIPATSSDEIGELIRAFNDVQLTAYDLATEQAIGRRNVSEMFVNLGRRNQQLLQRMLGKLTDLERDEEDPDTLEDLFALDNIVTRMRRNAESLLVLAGSQTPRQWSAPVPVDDAVRAAFGEVEGYERIDIAALSEVDIRGNVVADVAHLLAELLENSLNFSAATTKVLVSGQHERNGYLITIFDQGIGMDPDELEEANRRISDPPPLDQVPTKFLGLFVVGRLADRHGITVRLLEAPGRGIMARVQLPSRLLVGESDDVTTPDEPTLDTLGGDEFAVADLPTADLDEYASLEAEVEALQAEPLSSEPMPTAEPVMAGVDDAHFDEAAQAEALAAGLDQLPPRTTGSEPVFATSRPITDIEPDALPVRRRSDDPVEPAAELPTRELPTRPVAGAADSSSELPTRPVADSVDELPTRPVADSSSELPTRTRGASVGADDEQPLRRKTDGAAPQAADASQFSSMMSAFSSGVSRGMEESRFEAELDGSSTSSPSPSDAAADDQPATDTDEWSQS